MAARPGDNEGGASQFEGRQIKIWQWKWCQGSCVIGPSNLDWRALISEKSWMRPFEFQGNTSHPLMIFAGTTPF